MDSGANPRKRSARQPKLSATVDTASTMQDIDQASDSTVVTTQQLQQMDSSCKEIDASISPLADDGTNTNTPTTSAAAAECRRSSRKKIIKFDVLDVLNKNRKPHKIQIEARIDSNAPSPMKAVQGGVPGTVPNVAVAGGVVATADLTSKQKTFIEKSAIFRRYSISEQHNKIMTPLHPPLLTQKATTLTMLGKSVGAEMHDSLPVIDPVKIAQARRLSRTQQIFNASMMKSKQNTSLIVAQMQSSTSSSSSGIAAYANVATYKKTVMTASKRKSLGAAQTKILPLNEAIESRIVTPESTIQRRRGRPPKNKNIDMQVNSMQNIEGTKVGIDSNVNDVKIITEKAKNWQEYKECLKNTHTNDGKVLESKLQESNPLVVTDVEVKAEQNFATGELKTEEELVAAEECIFEISSSSCSTMTTEFQSQECKPVLETNESKQRSFAAVSFLQKNSSPSKDDSNTPEFIVAAVEEIIAETAQPAPISNDTLVEVDNIGINDSSKYVAKKSSSVTDTEKKAATENEVKPKTNIDINATAAFSRSYPKPTVIQRSSSSSESETNSERLGGKVYKKGDKLRVSIKRVSIPGSPTSTSSIISDSSTATTSTTNESLSEKSISQTSNTIISEQIAKKSPITKRSKRLQKKEDISKSIAGSQTVSVALTVPKTITETTEPSTMINEDRNTEKQTGFASYDATLETSSLIVSEKETKQNADEISGTVINNEEPIKETEMSDYQEIKQIKDEMCLETQQDVSREAVVSIIFPSQIETTDITTESVNLEAQDLTESKQIADIKIMKPSFEPKTEHYAHSYASKEPITLPLKKQVTKFKHFDISHEEQTSEIAAEIVAPDQLVTNENIIQNLNVETSTLLDILRTVQSNKEATTAITDTIITEDDNDNLSICEETSLSASNFSPTPTDASDKSTSTITTAKLSENKTKVSPPRSNITSPHTMKKVTRRYECRSRRGDASDHKTLEETFAAIAAQSSKEILELAALESSRDEDEIDKTTLKTDLDQIQSDEIVLEPTPEKKIEERKGKFENLPTELTSVENKLEDEPFQETTTINTIATIEEDCQENQETNDNIKQQDVNNPIEHTEKPQVEMFAKENKATTNDIKKVAEKSENEKVKQREQNEAPTTTTPTRRSRKTKIKSVTEVVFPAAAVVEESATTTEKSMETVIIEPIEKYIENKDTEKQRKTKKSKPLEEQSASAVVEKSSNSIDIESKEPIVDNTSKMVEPVNTSGIPEKEERTPLITPFKKRLSKMQSEFGEIFDITPCADKSSSSEIIPNVESSTPEQNKQSVLQTSDKESDKDGSGQKKNKKSKTPSKSNGDTKASDIRQSEEVQLPVTPASTITSKRGKHKQKTLEQFTQRSDSTDKVCSSGSSSSNSSISSNSSSKKNKKNNDDAKNRSEKNLNPKSSEKNAKEESDSKDKSLKKSEKKKFSDIEIMADVEELCKTTDEKSAKKKRQKKLREAFQAALNEGFESTSKYSMDTENSTESGTVSLVIGPHTPERQSPIHTLPLTPTEFDSSLEVQSAVHIKNVKVSVLEPEEDPDPLKDIEKFIEDGVNLLKRDYKIDDSVDEVISSKLIATEEQIQDKMNTAEVETTSKIEDPEIESMTAILGSNIESNESVAVDDISSKLEMIPASYETPADTPLATPSATPPPRSPTMDVSADEYSGVRRSHRIKQITKAPKALVGRGLVRDKERFSLKDDVETKTYYSLDDQIMDLAEVEAKNAKFLKDMEERLSNFQVIKENEYKCERIISREARKMICDCFLTVEEEERGELGCGDDCLNRLLMIECGPDCNVKERCTNKRFQKLLCSPCRVFRTEKKGFGIMADIEILPGEFIMEYVGEVIDGEQFESRRTIYSRDKNRHYYFMALRSDAIIDATIKGNISRFINHSCDPNAETQKWTVNGELRIGFFSRKSIMPGEEITFDYQYQRYGREAQRCYCESANCRGWIGEEPNSDEGEQIDYESDDENLAESLLGDDEDDDSDESVSDAEEVQKKLEIAAAEAKLMPISDELKDKDVIKEKKKKTGTDEDDKKENEEDSKSKFKKLLSKMAEKVAKKKKLKETEKKQRKQKRVRTPSEAAGNKSRYLEDPDIEDEVNFLSRCGLKTQSDTLRLSRLMVRAKLVQTRLNLLQILRKGELPCRRLFLDYHGLRLLHGWMSEDAGNMNIRMALLQTLESLPIANKTVLTDSKVYQSVRNCCGTSNVSVAGNSLSPSDESSKESSSSNSQSVAVSGSTAEEVPTDLQKLAVKLTSAWDSLPEIFRIPKRERIEQMKEHEREADRQYAAAVEDNSNKTLNNSDRYQRGRFGSGFASRFSKPSAGKEPRNVSVLGSGVSSGDPRSRRSALDSSNQSGTADNSKYLSKEQRRKMFAAKVARDEAEKRLAEERREFETKCRFFGLDPKKTRLQDMPFCVNPTTGQWYSVERHPIATPPSYAHVPVKPKSTDPADYQLPAVATSLPLKWKFAITTQGKIYYYHVQHRIPQWEPPTPAQCQDDDKANDSDSESDVAADESGEDNDDVLLGMDQAQIKAYIEKKIETRRQQRYNRLVGQREISPRREEDRIYNQLEVRKYKENKEKIRKRKEEIRRKRIDALKNSTLNMCTLGGLEDANYSSTDAQINKSINDSEEEDAGALPIQDYLLSSDEEDIKAECNNSPLIDKIVQGDKIVDELDALTTKRSLKRSLPPHRELSNLASTSAEVVSGSSNVMAMEKHEHKRRKMEKKEKIKKSKETDSKYRKLKEKFRCEIAGIIVQHLKPYRKDSCAMGRIHSDDDFNHLARKLTHFVMIKELKYCESVGQTLVVTESVKNKSREFIKKYMAKYGDVYIKPKNDPEFKDIPFTL